MDVKKQTTFERESRSKVLVICVIELKANEIDELLCFLKYPWFKYISYHKTTLQERLTAMYHNDNNNAKEKYEMLGFTKGNLW